MNPFPSENCSFCTPKGNVYKIALFDCTVFPSGSKTSEYCLTSVTLLIFTSHSMSTEDENMSRKLVDTGRWWMRGSLSHNIAERIILLIKDMSAGKLSEAWANVTRGAIAEAVLSLTKLDESKRTPGECIKTHTVSSQ